MITRRSMLAMAVVYTLVVAAAVSFTAISGATVFGVAAAWFSMGLAWRRLPAPEQSPPPAKWGRQ